MFKYLAAMAMSVALIGLSACKDPDPEPTPDNNSEPAYAFHYQGRTLEPNQTVYFYPTAEEVTNDWATIHILLENTTDANLQTMLKVERVGGSEAFDNLSICFGETCKIGTCPWTSDTFTLTPGVNQNMEVMIDYKPSNASTDNGVYRITVGKGASFQNSQVMLLNMSGHAQ